MGLDVVGLGLAKADAARRYADKGRLLILERDRPVPVATKAYPPADPTAVGLSDGVVTGGTAKLGHIAVRTARGFQLMFTNWRQGAAGTEQDGPNDIRVRAALEYPVTQVIPVTFNGNRQVAISPGGSALSDPIGVDIIKGTTFWTRTHIEVDPGSRFPRNNISTQSSGEGHNYANPTGTDLTVPGSASLTGLNTNTYVFGPAAIIGRPVDQGKASIALVGDSIMSGIGDSTANGGFAQRALAGNYSFQKVAFPGEALSGWIGSFGLTRQRRAQLLDRVGVTHVLTNYTVNSLLTTTIQQDAVTAWVVLSRYGPTYATTLTPQTTSTDAWATVGNQTVQYPADREPRRIAFNTWLRDGAPIVANAPVAAGSNAAGTVRAGQVGHPLAGYCEVADRVETARNSGIWKAAHTSDGTHPNATGHAAAAAGIPVAALFGVPSD